jgi:small-conductance mechanosensitive channel
MTAALLVAAFGSFFNQDFAGNPVSAWMRALVAFAVTLVVLGLTKRLVLLRLAKIAEHTETDYDDLLVDLVRRTSRFFLVVLGVYFAHHWLTLSGGAQNTLEEAIHIAIWIQMGLWGLGLVHFGIQRMIRGRAADDPGRTMGASVLGFIGRVLIWTVVLLGCLQAMGQPIGSLLASLGVGGIAVALALQNILGDLFASITILLDKPFVVGDSILLGDFNGTIEKIGVKSTRLRSVSGEEIIIGNQDLVSSRVRNFKRMRERRQAFTVGLVYGTSRAKIERITALLKEIVTSVPETRFDRAHFKALGPSSLDFEVVYFVLKPDFNTLMDVQHRINLEIYDRFAAEGVEFAYPTQTLHHVTPPTAEKPQKELSRG